MSRGSAALTAARKEEIFLALLQREYELWVAAMADATERKEAMTRDEIARTLTAGTERPNGWKPWTTKPTAGFPRRKHGINPAEDPAHIPGKTP